MVRSNPSNDFSASECGETAAELTQQRENRRIVARVTFLTISVCYCSTGMKVGVFELIGIK
jgi:hypothetical protein